MSGKNQPFPVEEFSEIEDLKSALRAAIRETRAQRSERLRKEAGQDIATTVLTIPAVKEARVVAAYTSRANEPSTYALLEYLKALGKTVLLPVLGAGLQRDWAEFISVEDLQQRAPGRPSEPSSPTLGPEALAAADAIIVPALAIDSTGTRLGQGGGWYDRALLHAREDALTIGVIFPEEFYPATSHQLPREDHDLPIDAVATTTSWRMLPSEGL
ncbi:5-formyltetrahydrofolate cyclo-ligase [Timonella senegalensis]|uniref:5-formyltetrahydrofolate cyclo-ligase n=1 Tax=Timonella senegalensis TaxID=1465825 RepID=UPI0028AE73DF|nr:5-formyltetrahydrofolate cyclo-ligase [Timonella senegalensis]